MSQWHRDNPELCDTPADPAYRPPREPALPVDRDMLERLADASELLFVAPERRSVEFNQLQPPQEGE